MSLSAGRVGVRADQVDSHGRVNSPSFFNEIMEDLPEWTDLPVRVNGTEQLIPSNPSVPVTSPILADIDYPDERRNDQYFTYRESPTTVDGLAKIKGIRGNTLVWNQLHQNQNGKSETAQYAYMLDVGSNFSVPSGHELLVFFTQPTGCEVYATGRTGISVTYQLFPSVTTPTVRSFIGTTTGNLTGEYMNGTVCLNATVSSAVQLTNCMIFDLTLMGLDVTADQFRALFPLPYYTYDSGSLLSFTGTGIKTTGENVANTTYEQGAVSNTINQTYAQSKTSNTLRIRSVNLIPSESGKLFKVDWNTSVYDCVVQAYNSSQRSTGASASPFNTWHTTSFTFTGTGYVAIAFKRRDGANITPSEIDAIRPNLYLAVTENTTNLPTETYFPTGMKSAGVVYDELTPTKAITRVKSVVFNGSEDWVYNQTTNLFVRNISDAFITGATTQYNIYTTNNRFTDTSWPGRTSVDGALGLLYGASYIYIKSTQFADVASLKTWLASNPVTVNYTLATPVELPTLSFE